MDAYQWLDGQEACEKAMMWLSSIGCPPLPLSQAWPVCDRPEWLLWLAGRAGIDAAKLIRVAVYIVRDASEAVHRVYPVIDDRDACRRAIDSAEAWCLKPTRLNGDFAMTASREAYDRSVAAAARASNASSAEWGFVEAAVWAVCRASASVALAAARAHERVEVGAFSAQEAVAWARSARPGSMKGYADDVRGMIEWETVADHLRALGVEA